MEDRVYSYKLVLAAEQSITEGEYWLEKLSGQLTRSFFPYDYRSETVSEPLMQAETFKFPGTLESALMKLSKGSSVDIKLHMLLVTGLFLLLHKYTGSSDIMIGSPLVKQEIQCEFINNLLVFRNDVKDHMSFKDLLLQTRETILQANKHQNYPLEILFDRLNLPVKGRECPLFDVVVSLENLYDKRFIRNIHYNMGFFFFRTGESISGEVEYNSLLYRESTVKQIIRHYLYLLEQALLEVNRKLSHFQPLSEKERRQVLVDFNKTSTDYPQHKLLHRLFEEQVEKTPDQITLIGKNSKFEIRNSKQIQMTEIQNSKQKGTKGLAPLFDLVSITYKELNVKSDRLAHLLWKKGVRHDTVIGIMVERSMEMIIGILGILKAGGAYLPIDTNYPEERIKYMLEDSSAKLLVTTSNLVEDRKMGRWEDRKNLEIVLLDFSTLSSSHLHLSPSPVTCQVSPTNLAYIIYTSGTTGKPKGVMVEHANVVAYLYAYYREFEIGPEHTIIQLASYTFDASVEEIFPLLLTGGKVIFPDHFEIIDIHLLSQLIIKHRVNIIDCTPLLLNEFNKIISQQLSYHLFKGEHALIIISGGDVLKREHVDHFLKIGNVYNTYGPTETTICAAYYRYHSQDDPSPHALTIPIGKPISNYSIYILDENRYPVPIGVTGELYISGDGVTRGYLNRPELTNEKFLIINDKLKTVKEIYRLYRSYMSYMSYVLYKTGDLGRWLPGGNIEFLGRKDRQVKIRGYRIETGEIENRLLKFDQIKDSVVALKQDKDGDKYLCAYIIAKRKAQGARREETSLTVDTAGLRTYLAKELPEYMIPSYFVLLEEIPLTPSGKPDFKALPEPRLKVETGYAPPRDPVEEELVRIWSEVLGIDKDIIGIDADFFQLGGHSLKATTMVSEVYKKLNTKMSLADVFDTPSIRGLAAYIKRTAKNKYTSIPAAEKKEYYQLSAAQRRTYILQQMQTNSTVYNISGLVPIQVDKFDGEVFENILKQLINRHESLRTSFHLLNDEPVQRIHDVNEVEFKIEYYRTESKAQSAEPEAFDLSRVPLVRIGLIKTKPGQHILMVDMHHIISDGVSIEILVGELLTVYKGQPLPGLRIRYKDFAEWQQRPRVKETTKKQEDYWLKVFEGEIPVLNLPTDYARPAVQHFEGSSLDFNISAGHTRALESMAAAQGVTLYMILLALVNILFSKLTSQEDMIIGTPVAGRRHADLENIIGMFVNTLALRNYLPGEKTFKEFLKEIKKKTLEAFENQDYPFEDLVEKVNVHRNASRNPLFDVLFTLITFSGDRKVPGAPDQGLYQYERESAKFDLTVMAIKEQEKLFFTFNYSTKLFKKETIERFFAYLKKIISGIKENIETGIAEIEIISNEEKEQILSKFNDTESEYPKEKTLYQLFEEQVKRIPDRTALHGFMDAWMHEDVRLHLTYRELNKESSGLAQVLREKGVGPDIIAAVIIERSVEMIIGILGILKAGGAYLPITPDYPEERIKYILEDSKAKYLLKKDNIFSGLKGGQELFVLNFEHLNFEFVSDFGFRISNLSASNLAYVIYTSGTTGRPKGVMVEQKNVVRLVKNTNYIEFKEDDQLLQTGALSFDASTFEIWGALLNGLKLVLSGKDRILNPQQLKETIRTLGITTMWLTAPLFNQMLDEDIEIFAELKALLVGGDVLSPFHINRLRIRYPWLVIINGYGPTENTTFSTTFPIHDQYTWRIPIGTPISNSTAYIVDKNNHLVPIGVYGELLVGGDGIARGYLNDPELTAEKFLPVSYSYNRSYMSYMTYIHKKIYKTGDLGRWLPDGNIDFLGRMDSQVKIRGYRIELGEIENRLLNYPFIEEAVVITREGDDKYLYAYIVPKAEKTAPGGNHRDAGIELEALKTYLSHSLPDYMIPHYFVELNVIPLTANGKVDINALPVPGIGPAKAESMLPRDVLEQTLAGIWAEVLGIKKESIGIDDDFFQLGGHSLKATALIARIHHQLDVKLPLVELFKASTIRALAEYLKDLTKAKCTAVEPVDKKEYYGLSSAQKRLYILHRMDLDSTAYNMPMIFSLPGEPDIKKLQESFKKLIKHHESLRTSFHMVENQPIQRVHDVVEFNIEFYEGTGGLAPLCEELAERKVQSMEQDKERCAPGAVRRTSFIRPFNLEKAPLLRVGIVSPRRGVLMVDMHHIISDAASHSILLKQFTAFYRDKDQQLAPLRIQYKDYASWQSSEKQEERIKIQETYWLKEFAGEVPIIDLPTDFTRPDTQDFAGDSFNFDIGTEETWALKEIAAEQGITLFMLLLAIYIIMLSKISGQEDIVMGTDVQGRTHPDLEYIVGMFVNTIPLRNFPSPGKTIKDFLQQVKQRTLKALDNQDYQFEDLVDQLAMKMVISRDASRNPLFDVMFSFFNIELETGKLSQTQGRGPEPETYPYESKTAKFDLTLNGTENNQNLSFYFDYCTKLFKKQTIQRFTRYFKQVVSAVIKNRNQKIAGIEVISPKEKEYILYEFNNTGKPIPRDKSYCQLFDEQVNKTPHKIAVMHQKHHLTYNELNRESHCIAYHLSAHGAIVNEFVVLYLERSIPMLAAIIAVLKTGQAYVPIEKDYPAARTAYILRNSEANIVVTEPHTLAMVNQLQDQPGTGKGIICLDPHRRAPSIPPGHSFNAKPSGPDHLVYMIYTSGTTGQPKGVMIHQLGMINHLYAKINDLSVKAGDIIAQTASAAFDISIWQFLAGLLTGGTTCIIDKEVVLDPRRFLRVLGQQRVTILESVPSLITAFLETAASEPLENKTLNHLRWMIPTGEALTVNLVREWYRHYPGIKLVNAYGPTEASDDVTHYIAAEIPYETQTTIPIGKPLQNLHIYILDKNLSLCPVGIKGEICVAGLGVGKGYWQDREKTKKAFIPNPYLDQIKDYDYAYLYKTGDMGYLREDGNIEFLGRVDHQVKIRGYRIELGEIENKIGKHPLIKEAVVLEKETGKRNKYLCAYMVSKVETPPPVSQIREYLAVDLPGYMIPAYFIFLDEMPLTVNGKIDRRALSGLQFETGEEYAAPANKLEETLVRVWSEVLGIQPDRISTGANFFELGGHSLNATIMIAAVHKVLQVKIPLAEIFRIPSIRGLSQCIKRLEPGIYASIEPVEEKEYYPLSPTQRRLYFLQQWLPDETAYNLPYQIPLAENIHKEKPGAIFKRLISRHASLRTSFEMADEIPVQRIHQNPDFSIECYDVGEADKGAVIVNFIRPFDLSQAPLLRVGLVTIESSRQVLLIDMHHIITDGTSQDILAKEFTALYSDPAAGLSPLKLQYKDFSEWQNSEAQQQLIQQQEAYWRKEFSHDAELPVLDLPTDYPRPLMQSFDGNMVDFGFNTEETMIIKTIGQENQVTLYMCLLAIFTILFSKLGSQEDIVLGTPIAARRHDDLRQIVGMFVNTLPMRNYPTGDKTFKEFLKEVRQRTSAAYENQEYPFELLVERLFINRDTSRNPIFDIMLNLLNQSEFQGEISEAVLSGQHTTQHYQWKARFDMTINVAEMNDIIYFQMEYSTRLYRPSTIDRFINYLKNIVRSLPGNTDSRLSHISMLSQEEKREILSISTGVEETYHHAQTIHRLFEEQVQRTPDHVALTGQFPNSKFQIPNKEAPFGRILNAFGEMNLSYRDLNEKTDQLAYLLQKKGVKPDTAVAIMVERSIEMIVAVIGILKAGAGYLPIDPAYPEDRIKYMLTDSGAKFLFTDLSSGPSWLSEPNFNCQLSIVNDQLSMNVVSNSHLPLSPGVNAPAAALVYIIYTSGSTGRPKGVMLEHKNLVNLIRYQYNHTDIDFSCVLQFTTISFDVSAQEIFSTLLAGGRLCLVFKETLADIPQLFKHAERNHIKTLFLPASFLRTVMNEESFVRLIPDSISHMVTAGEQVIINDRFKRYLQEKGVYFHNHYGPSETHVVTAFTIEPGADIPVLPPIGRPVLNTWIYILDKGSRLVPPGVTGELHIGGIQVGRGYLNNPELSNSKFQIPNKTMPFNRKFLRGVQGGSFFKKRPPGSTRRIYKTGDLARWLKDGNIEFLGRMDHQVKIRGFRVELEEIESQLLNHPGVKDAVVTAKAVGTGDKYLCAYVIAKHKAQSARRGETSLTVDTAGLRDYLARELPEYMIPTYFVFLERLPLTPSRKIDRRQLPEPDGRVGTVTKGYAAPGNETEEKLLKIWAQVLDRDEASAGPVSIGIDDNFFELGGHSLKATILAVKIHKAFQVKFPLAEVFKTPSIREQARYIREAVRDKYAEIEVIEKRDYYELSPGQKRLYILHQMDPESTAYNMPMCFPLPGEPDIKELKRTFEKLIVRHESLRTSFHILDSQPVQRVDHAAEFEIEYDGAERMVPGAGGLASFIRPFDLAKGPLLRVGLAKLDTANYLLIADIHHIITDGTSQLVLEREFMALYPEPEKELPPLRLQYKDYAVWQNLPVQEAVLKQQENYWLQSLYGELPKLGVPLDYPRPPVQRFEGKTISFVLEEIETQGLKEIAGRVDATLYMVLLSVFTIMLAKLSSQEDIIVGTPVAGRRHADLEHIIGFFLNTLVMRNYPAGNKGFIDFLKEVKERTLNAYENQEYQFEDLVDKLGVQRDTSRNPIFDVMFNLLNYTEYANIDSLFKEEARENHEYQLLESTSKFDMNLRAIDMRDTLLFNLEYSTSLFKPETIQRMIGYFKEIVNTVIAVPYGKISRIDIIPAPRKKEKLARFNEDLEDPTLAGTLQDKLLAGVKVFSHRIAVKYNALQITYHELDNRTTFISNWLREKRIRKGTFIGIFVQDRIEVISLVMGIVKAGCVFVPLYTNLPDKGIEKRIQVANVRFIFTDAANRERLVGIGNAIGKTFTTFVADDSFYPDDKKYYLSGNKVKCNPEDKLYIIFTSGTTGTPQAILGKNKSLLHFIHWEIQRFGVNEAFKFAQFTNPSFDPFLRDIFVPLCAGGTICIPGKGIMSNQDRMVQWIEQNAIDLIHMVPSLFKVLSSASLDKNNFQDLKYLLLAGEKLNPVDVKKWYDIFDERIQLVNMYGPAETTLAKAYYFVRPADVEKGRIPIGNPMRGARMILLDKEMNICDRGMIGEIYIRTPYRSFGYYHNSRLNKERFVLNPFREKHEAHDDSDLIYKTGDLARELADGSLEFIGRTDRQVKVRGVRIELGEIESLLLNHPGVRETVVISKVDDKGEVYLCAYVVGGKESPGSFTLQLRKYLLNELPKYMVPSYFMCLSRLPLTPNGKIDFNALPGPVTVSSVEYAPPRSAVEKKLVEIWTEVLGGGLVNSSIGIDDNFFELGGHSLKATILVAKMQSAFNVKLPLVNVFKAPTIRRLADYIKEAETYKFTSIEPVEKKDYYPLSSAQMRLYVLQQMEPGNIAYNLFRTIRLPGDFVVQQLEDVLKRLIQRHDSLRTSFEMAAGEPVQKVHDGVEFEVEYYDAARMAQSAKHKAPGIERNKERCAPGALRYASFIRPFDLSQAPLLRLGWIKTDQQTNLLLVDIHHIIADGISLNILTKELTALHEGKQLPPLQIQYKDFSHWQAGKKEKENTQHQEAYWLKRFEEEVPLLNIPCDFPRPLVQSFEGESINFEISAEVTASLKAVALQESATLYMVLLAIFNILLSRLSGQEDIVIGTPVAGRRHKDLERIIGMFVNTLALRNYPQGWKTVREFLHELNTHTLEAFEHQEYPFEDLVEKVVEKRDVSRNPLFDTMFALHNIWNPTAQGAHLLHKGAASMTDYYEKRVSRFDMNWNVLETGNRLVFVVEYCTKLFKRETILRFISYFKKMIGSLAQTLEIPLALVEIMSEEEKNQVLFDFNNTGVEYSRDKPFHWLFQEQVVNTPHMIAVVSRDSCLTYQCLNQRTIQLARLLRNKGVKPGAIVGLMVDRSLEIMVGILAILKAGGAYLPIEVKHPQGRIQYIFKDSQSAFVLTQREFLDNLVEGCEPVDIDKQEFINEELVDPDQFNTANDLIYVTYTSGSSGRPKGVMISHRSMVNFIKGMTDVIEFRPGDRMLSLTTISFDIFGLETLLSLTRGLTVVIGSSEEQLNPSAAASVILNFFITILQVTPSRLSLLVSDENAVESLKKLTYLLVGGEAFPEVLYDRVKEITDCRVYNLYGPTETTIWSTLKELRNKEPIDIGKPIANTQIFILSPMGHLQPIGVIGELSIAGDGVARGYLNNPGLTAEKFYRTYRFYRSHRSYRSYVLYRTGDLARWLSDGNIEFLGRIDHQVKVRGNRIELGEIESQLTRHPGIKDAVVIPRSITKEKNDLCAYIIANKEFAISELREYLANDLPAYMIPSYFMLLEEFPLTPNRKIDRKALPVPELKPLHLPVEPRNPVEEKLVNIWCNLLGIKQVGIRDNFFELGGQSMGIIKLASEIKKTFNIEMNVMQLFRIPTIEDIAGYILSIEQGVLINQYQEETYLIFNSSHGNNLFFFPPLIGYGVVYKPLADFLADFSVYSFNFIEKNNRIRQYADIIMGIREKGSYVLFGYSAGGNLAFETAKEIEKRGGKVSDVIFLDAFSREVKFKMNTAEQLHYFFSGIEKGMDHLGIGFLKEKIIAKSRAFAHIFENSFTRGVVNANVHHITAEDRKDKDTQFARQIGNQGIVFSTGWSQYTTKNHITYKGFGEHQQMLHSGFLEKNAEIIKKILAANKE